MSNRSPEPVVERPVLRRPPRHDPNEGLTARQSTVVGWVIVGAAVGVALLIVVGFAMIVLWFIVRIIF